MSFNKNPNEHPIEFIDKHLASVHKAHPIVEAILNRLEILDSKRFEVQVMERSFNMVGLKLQLIRNAWIIKPREMNDQSFNGEKFYKGELYDALKCLGSLPYVQ